ncbi:alpha/beta hydrolase [Actinoplanes sp. NBRC 103695]|uniref:alpha/beta hydrolase n=1 Tax=Actinoplanes sp. NBRC 103695 TaxID=3032202 RepID=UPI0024A011DA|nr:alpha/beta hydrolase [Actinoplanes sp. NBRC 103695]GLY97244.1 peptidase [Actinoplanes sp. NBRC 103695]
MVFLAVVASGMGVPAAVAGQTTAGADRFSGQTLTWEPCNDNELVLDCTDVTVPVDWSRPQGQTIELRVHRHKASGPSRGSLLLNPGGPGGLGKPFLEFAARMFSRPVIDGFDLVSFDPRGVGESAPLSCPAEADAAFRKSDPSPDDLRERIAREAAARTWVRACRAKSGPIFDHVDTVSAARDLDVLRAVLGDDKLSYFGGSYGTRLGLRYADLFPTRIKRMVLDAVVDPAQDNRAFLTDVAKGEERGLDAYLSTCDDRAGCPFHGLSLARSRAAVAKLFKAADQQPAEQLQLVNLTEDYLSNPAGAPELDSLFTAVRAGDHSVLEPDPDTRIDQSAIQCLDLPDRRSAAQVMADTTALTRKRPVFGPEVMSGTPCPQWPGGGVSDPHPVTARGSVPIVLLAGTGDPAALYEWGRSAAADLENGRLLTRKGNGHGSYVYGACRPEVDRYLLDGVPPPRGGAVCAV